MTKWQLIDTILTGHPNKRGMLGYTHVPMSSNFWFPWFLVNYQHRFSSVRSGLDGKSSISWISQLHTQHFLSEWPIHVYLPVIRHGVLENSLMNSMILRAKLPDFFGISHGISSIFQDFPRYQPPSFSGMSHMFNYDFLSSKLQLFRGVTRISLEKIGLLFDRGLEAVLAIHIWPTTSILDDLIDRGMRICQDLPIWGYLIHDNP